MSDISTGVILRRSPKAMGSILFRYPADASRKLVLERRVRVKWTSTRINDLSSRPLQHCRCLQYGHVRNNCRSALDLSDRCFACGEASYNAKD